MRSILISTCLSCSALTAIPATAQEAYPSRPITVVVPSPAGGTTDVVARIFAKKMQETLGQPIVVDNRAGANGYIGTQAMLRAPKDGYQLVVMSGSLHSFTPAMVEKMPFDPIEDFALVSRLISFPYVLVSSTKLPYKSIGELQQAGTAAGSNLSYASFGVGSSPHLITEWWKLKTNVQALHVPYKGGGQASTDIISGQVSFMFNSLPSAMAQIKGNQVRALALTTPRRSASLPGVPTLSESTPGLEVIGWLGLAASKGTPSVVTDKLRVAVQTAAKDPVVISQLEQLGAEPLVDQSAAEFHSFLVAERNKWESVVRDAKIPKEKE